MTDTRWQRRGFSLLWGAEAFVSFAAPDEAVTMREFFNLRAPWPDALPSARGNALVVVGLEGCMDMLTPVDAEEWLREDFKRQVSRFQSEYESEKALIFWLPGGRVRVRPAPFENEYFWICAPPNAGERLQLGRCLWAGTENDAQRIIASNVSDQDPDGPAWAGLFHPRFQS